MRKEKSMKLSQLQSLAKKVQLESSQLYQTQAELTLTNLQQLTKNYSTHKIKPEIICHNAIVSTKKFLIIHKEE